MYNKISNATGRFGESLGRGPAQDYAVGENVKEERIMKKLISGLLSLSLLMAGVGTAVAESTVSGHKLLYQGHGSLRIVTREGKVIDVKW